MCSQAPAMHCALRTKTCSPRPLRAALLWAAADRRLAARPPTATVEARPAGGARRKGAAAGAGEGGALPEGKALRSF